MRENQGRIRAVIFDFGNVLTMPQDEGFVASMRQLAGLDSGAFRNAYRTGRREYDRGTLDSAAYWRGVLASGGRPSEEVARLDGGLVSSLTELDVKSWTVIRGGMVPWVRDLRAAGFATAILSNMPLDHALYIERSFDWLELFDVRLFSYSVELVKPEAGIYEECLKRLGLQPAETLFLDDVAENIEGARAVGMRGIEFGGLEGLPSALEEFPSLPRPRR